MFVPSLLHGMNLLPHLFAGGLCVSRAFDSCRTCDYQSYNSASLLTGSVDFIRFTRYTPHLDSGARSSGCAESDAILRKRTHSNELFHDMRSIALSQACLAPRENSSDQQGQRHVHQSVAVDSIFASSTRRCISQSHALVPTLWSATKTARPSSIV